MQIFETKVNDDDNRISNKLPLVKKLRRAYEVPGLETESY